MRSYQDGFIDVGDLTWRMAPLCNNHPVLLDVINILFPKDYDLNIVGNNVVVKTPAGTITKPIHSLEDPFAGASLTDSPS